MKLRPYDCNLWNDLYHPIHDQWINHLSLIDATHPSLKWRVIHCALPWALVLTKSIVGMSLCSEARAGRERTFAASESIKNRAS
jgi:hypothetical protein